VRVCECVFASARMRAHVCVYVYLHAHTHTHTHTHTGTHTHRHTHTHAHTHTHVYIYIYIYVYVHASPRRVGRYNFVPGEYICVTNTGSIRAGIKARTAPRRAAPHRTALHCTAPHCTAPQKRTCTPVSIAHHTVRSAAAAQRSARPGWLAPSHGTVCEQPGPIVAADVDAIVPFDNEART
jgi:hypothetical protein